MNNNNDNDDDGAQRWAEAQRAMYGQCAVRTEDKEELHAIDEDRIAIDVIVAAAITPLQQASRTTRRWLQPTLLSSPPPTRYDERADDNKDEARMGLPLPH